MTDTTIVKLTLLKTDGTKEEILSNPSGITLEKLQALVGGYVEFVRLDDENILLVNEEGLIHRLPQNPHIPQLVGDVVKMTDTDWELINDAYDAAM